MKFYKLTYEDAPRGLHVVADDETAERLYRYVPTTGFWHLDNILEPEFLFGDEGARFTRLAVEEAAALLPSATALDLRYVMARAVQREWEEQITSTSDDVRTSAQLGLPETA